MDARAFAFDWADLELFLAVARAGSLAGAGLALRIDASTAHRRIAKLEESLRTRLFSRSPRGYALTNAGHELLPYATSIDEQATAARRKLSARDDALTGTVRVSAADYLAANVLSPIVASFRTKHPGVTVAVDVRSSFADLARQQADLAIRISSRKPEGDLIAKHVAKIAGAFYGSRAYFAKHGRPRRVEDLRDHAIVRAHVNLPALPGERTLDSHANPERIAFRSESFLARFAAIRDGVGIGALACFTGDREPGLERLPFAVSGAETNLWLVLHVDLRQNARVRAFSDHIYAALAAQRRLFEGLAPQPQRRRWRHARGPAIVRGSRRSFAPSSSGE